MNLFEFLKNKKDFVYISQIPNVKKFFDIGNRMSIWEPLDPSKALYKDYNSTIKTRKGDFNFAPLSEREHFVNKIFKSFPRCNLILSIIKNKQCKNYYIELLKINSAKLYDFKLNITYYDIFNNELKTINISLYDDIAVRMINDKEEKILIESLKILNKQPKPIKEVIVVSYKLYNNYKDYKKDCIKYDFYIYDENIFNLFMSTYKSNYLLYEKEGNLIKVVEKLENSIMYKIINK